MEHSIINHGISLDMALVGDIGMPKQWYALNVKSNKEEVVFRQVRLHGVEVFYPCHPVKPVNPRARRMNPYFPGYMFVYVNLDGIGKTPLQWMPYTMGLVQFGGEPAVVPEYLIYAVKQKLQENYSAGSQVSESLRHGDPIKVINGPFEGFEGIFDESIPGNKRVKILLRYLVQHQVPIEMDVSLIEKKRFDGDNKLYEKSAYHRHYRARWLLPYRAIALKRIRSTWSDPESQYI